VTICRKSFRLHTRDGNTARKLILLDIDGTLISAEGYVPVSAVTACREARRQGHVIYLCSGRPGWLINGELLAVGFDGVISSGGAYIETGNTGGEVSSRRKVILDTEIPAGVVKQIAVYLDGRQCGFSLEKKGRTVSSRYYISHWESVLDSFTEGGKGKKPVFPIDKFIDELKESPLSGDLESYGGDVYGGVKKMMFVGNNTTSFEVIKQAFDRVCEIFHGSMPHCGKRDGEIGPLGVHKGTALKKTAEYHGIPLADTIAFGDSDNDCKMIECAGIGVAMGNANEDLKKIADYITDSPGENGIFNGFKKLGLLQG